MTSPKTGQYVYVDEVVVAYEQTINSDGVHRLRCDRGWISVTAADGHTVVLEPTSLLATGDVSLDSSGNNVASGDEQSTGSKGRPGSSTAPSGTTGASKTGLLWRDSRAKRPPSRKSRATGTRQRIQWDLGGFSSAGADYHHPMR